MKTRSILALGAVLLAGCAPSSAPPAANNSSSAPSTATSAGKPVGTFSLAWSEYPSWSVFGVAGELGLIEKEAGKLGSLEKKHNVDIELKFVDYDSCIGLYGSSTVDAVCITNMDILGPANGRASTAILPTSTSNGADACVALGKASLEELKGTTTYGLERSVSQYCFERCLESKGLKPADYPFANMDPGAAALAMQTGDAKVQSIIVWNPFVMQTLRLKPEAKVLFDSSSIPEEIVDMVVVANDSLAKPGGDAFAKAIVEAFYEVNRQLADPAKGDETLTALGANFAKLELSDMKTIVQQTKFYDKPAAGAAVFQSDKFRQTTMPAVVSFCASHGIIDKQPSIGFDDAKAQVNFTDKYLR